MISVTDNQSKASSPAAAARLPSALAERVGHLLARSHFAMRQQAEEALDELGLGTAEVDCAPRHIACLKVIADEGPLSQQALGRATGLDRTTMVAVIDFLEERGSVERRRNPKDRRAYALEATDKGQKWLDRAWPVLVEAEREYLAPLSASERRQLTALLQRLLLRD
jgi:DNA-binding MarR family transcriptional regulator